jgi:hypothetical protein
MAVPISIYKNTLYFTPQDEYMYNDAYLVVYQNGDVYTIYEATNELVNLGYNKGDINELTDTVNDKTCCGRQLYELIYYNPSKNKMAFENFKNSILKQ